MFSELCQRINIYNIEKHLKNYFHFNGFMALKNIVFNYFYNKYIDLLIHELIAKSMRTVYTLLSLTSDSRN